MSQVRKTELRDEQRNHESMSSGCSVKAPWVIPCNPLSVQFTTALYQCASWNWKHVRWSIPEETVATFQVLYRHYLMHFHMSPGAIQLHGKSQPNLFMDTCRYSTAQCKARVHLTALHHHCFSFFGQMTVKSGKSLKTFFCRFQGPHSDLIQRLFFFY